MEPTRRDLWWWLLLALGLASAGNGIWMLLDALGWFARVASDVTPANAHFVRDVGAAYLATGAALAWAAFRPAWRLPLVAPAALFHALHALGHVRETASGELAASHWLADLPTIYLPALLLLVMVASFARRPSPTAARS
jgi:hypothetical protein